MGHTLCLITLWGTQMQLFFIISMGHSCAPYFSGDRDDGAVKMKSNEGDVRLSPLPSLLPYLSGSGAWWKYFTDRSEFTAVLSDGRPVCLKLYL